MDCGNTRACAAPDINKHSKDKAHDRESTTKSSIAPPATASESAIRSRGPLRWNCRPDSAICSLWNGRRGHGRFKCRGVHQRCGAARGERVRSKEPSQRWNMHCKVVHREMAAVVARHELIAGEATAELFTRAIFSRTCPCFWHSHCGRKQHRRLGPAEVLCGYSHRIFHIVSNHTDWIS